jgi:hypothetical protein
MKVTLDLPEYLVREIKLRAVIQERTVKDLVAETLRQGLGLAEKPAQALRVLDELIEINAQGFPVFRCPPDAPASKMTTEELLQLEQDALYEEDLRSAGISH